jgi:hypothetical protein
MAVRAPMKGLCACFNADMTSNQPWWQTWPVAEVAAAILPWFASNPSEFEGFVTAHIVHWMRGVPSKGIGYTPSVPFEDPDLRAVAEAIQVLEHARLVMRSPGERGHVGLTRLGMHALQTDSVRQHLGLDEARPQS